MRIGGRVGDDAQVMERPLIIWVFQNLAKKFAVVRFWCILKL
jgi:hypothetical protein